MLTRVAGGEPTLRCWQPRLVFSSKERGGSCLQDRSLPPQQALLSSPLLLFPKPGSVLATGIANRERGMPRERGGSGTRQAAWVAAWCCALASVSCGLDVSLEEGSVAQRLSGPWELIATVWGESE